MYRWRYLKHANKLLFSAVEGSLKVNGAAPLWVVLEFNGTPKNSVEAGLFIFYQ
jgi:hypothetical protein